MNPPKPKDKPAASALVLVEDEWRLILFCLTYPEDVWNAGDDTHDAIRHLTDKLTSCLPASWGLRPSDPTCETLQPGPALLIEELRRRCQCDACRAYRGERVS